MIRHLWRSYRDYWHWLLRGFRQQFAGHWPILATLLIFPIASGGALCAAECSSNPSIAIYEDAVYVTWITMATVGYGDKTPETGPGKVVVSVDALVGLILVGVVVWFFNNTLRSPGRPTKGHTRRAPGRPSRRAAPAGPIGSLPEGAHSSTSSAAGNSRPRPQRTRDRRHRCA